MWDISRDRVKWLTFVNSESFVSVKTGNYFTDSHYKTFQGVHSFHLVVNPPRPDCDF